MSYFCSLLQIKKIIINYINYLDWLTEQWTPLSLWELKVRKCFVLFTAERGLRINPTHLFEKGTGALLRIEITLITSR
jgi:hypothetical protein